LFVAAGEAPVGVALDNGGQLFSKSDGLPGLRVLFFAQHAGPLVKVGRVLTLGTLSRLFDEAGADDAFHLDVLPCRDALDQVAPPGSETVDPALHRVGIPPWLRDAKLAAPAVVAEPLHGRLPPLL